MQPDVSVEKQKKFAHAIITEVPAARIREAFEGFNSEDCCGGGQGSFCGNICSGGGGCFVVDEQGDILSEEERKALADNKDALREHLVAELNRVAQQLTTS